jgi:hypothetical protein
MNSPEKPDLVVEPMQPVIKKIFSQNQHDPVYGDQFKFNEFMAPAIIQDHEIKAPEEQIKQSIHQHQVYIGESILPGICFLVPVVG